jgi:8-oxo-dGTP pyrophosphatase MutT (NUDIX family)
MVAGAILPITIHKNKLYFLFGKENELADTPGFSDFGGGVEGDETPYTTALREGGEEMTGFLGDGKAIEELALKHGGFMTLVHDTYHIHLFYMDYDMNLPKYYNNNHRFLWERMDKDKLEKTRLFEKSEIAWFSANDMKSRVSEFRKFYQKIITNTLLSKMKNISIFARKCSKKESMNHRKTKKRGGQ